MTKTTKASFAAQTAAFPALPWGEGFLLLTIVFLLAAAY